MASATASTVAQAIATNPQASILVQTSHNLTQSAKAANPKPFDGNQDQTKEFVRAIWIMVTMQADTFVDERMKILYVLSFMRGGMAQAIAMNPQASISIQTLHNPTQSAKAADPEPFDGNWDQTEESVRAIWIMVTMQADTFVDERMKILYALLFMCRGTAQVWAVNETMAVISHNRDISDADIGHLSGKC